MYCMWLGYWEAVMYFVLFHCVVQYAGKSIDVSAANDKYETLVKQNCSKMLVKSASVILKHLPSVEQIQALQTLLCLYH